MQLDSAQRAQLTEQLRAKSDEPPLRCFACQACNWQVPENAAAMPKLLGPRSHDRPHAAPLVAVVCQDCGNSALVDLPVATANADSATTARAANTARQPLTDPTAAREMIARTSWYHSFEILPGITTPGQIEMNAAARLDMFGVAADLKGIKALDIGTWDGPVAFELERRGAEVTALDVQDPNETGFNTAKTILDSRVTYVKCDVVGMRNVLQNKFDLVIFCGVFYHLKNPVEAFESISLLLAESGIVCFEGEGFLHYAETTAGVPVTDLPLTAMAQSDVPLALSYAAGYKQASNWFVPNLACLKSWLTAAGLTMTMHDVYSRPDEQPFPAQRIFGTAVKSGSPFLEHPLVGKSYRLNGH